MWLAGTHSRSSGQGWRAGRRRGSRCGRASGWCMRARMQPATARALIGAAAPAFTLTDSNGRNLSLADFKGKTVVLEWTNHECSYVGEHYRGNNMQALQQKMDRPRRGVAVGDLLGARPAGLCLDPAS